MLSCRDLTKRFGALAATQGVSLDIAPGERHGIIGPNGAGKTTLFNLLGGEVLPDSGSIRLAGRDITRLRPDQRARRGLARSFQKNSCFAAMTVRQNLAVASLLAPPLGARRLSRWVAPPASVGDAVAEVAAAVGCEEMLDQVVSTLSYGTQRQLEVGLALAGQPQVLLLDEPTAGMSPEETRRMQALVARLPRALSVLIIEHDMDVIFGLAERITVLDRGEVLLVGTPDEVRRSHLVRARYLGDLV